MSTNTLNEFLGQISLFLRTHESDKLREFLIIEPPYSSHYMTMINELNDQYPLGQEDALEMHCANLVPEARDGEGGTPWTAFLKFLVSYFGFIRTVNLDDLLGAYNLLSELQQRCNSALRHTSQGVLILPTIVTYSRLLARLAIGLNKQPELIAHIATQFSDDEGSESLPERAANLIRDSFVICLNEKPAPTSSAPRAGFKKAGIYKLTNICLQILYSCRKTRNAEQIFNNIHNQSPPLSGYPRSERVTYLYYLGRFHFSCNHFIRAKDALQAAHDECHVQCLKQKRLILIYLTASNIILGRFPTQAVYSLPEATEFQETFQPLCKAIAQGDLATFRRLTDYDGPRAKWMLYFRILLQLRNRCEVLVWRSLIRKTFILSGFQGDSDARKAPTLDLANVLVLARFLERQQSAPGPNDIPGRRHTNWILMQKPDQPPAQYVDPDFEGVEEELGYSEERPTMLEIVSIFCSLIKQNLLGGFISKRQEKFAIQGSRNKGTLPAGFPNVWQTIDAKNTEVGVPGWKLSSSSSGPDGRPGAGTVINLSGARPVGVGV